MEENTSMNFAENLMSLRKSKGWSQEELGNMVGVSRQTVSKWEMGQTTPEMDKLIILSNLFQISIEQLLGRENNPYNGTTNATETKTSGGTTKKDKFHYEYISDKKVGKRPLLHINVGLGAYKSNGFFSIGMISKGIFSLGLISMGVVSMGLISLGLLSIAMLGLGLFSFAGISAGILSFGGISVGVLAFGGVAVGVFAVGGLAVGMYSIGGLAIASNVAFGGLANAHIAIGDEARGEFCYFVNNIPKDFTPEMIRETILTEFPSTPGFIANLFSKLTL